MHRGRLSTRTLATLALAGIGTYVAGVIALQIIQRGRYHPLSQAVSELALGRDGWLMAIGFCAAGAGMLCFALLIRRILPSTAAPIMLAISALFTFVSAVFHADGDTKTTLHGQIHQTAGILSFSLVIAAMFVCSRHFRRDPAWRRLARPTAVWAICAICTFFLVPALGSAYFGLAQRIFLAVCLAWPITVAVYVRRTAPTTREAARATSITHVVGPVR
jgi:hypothetical protein